MRFWISVGLSWLNKGYINKYFLNVTFSICYNHRQKKSNDYSYSLTKSILEHIFSLCYKEHCRSKGNERSLAIEDSNERENVKYVSNMWRIKKGWNITSTSYSRLYFYLNMIQKPFLTFSSDLLFVISHVFKVLSNGMATVWSSVFMHCPKKKKR